MSDKHGSYPTSSDNTKISDMSKSDLWQDPSFPHFYYNPAVVAPLEEAFKQEVKTIVARINPEQERRDKKTQVYVPSFENK